MTARSEQVAFVPPLRWILPAAGLALIAAVAQAIRRRARRPVVSAMSSQWLREHVADPLE